MRREVEEVSALVVVVVVEAVEVFQEEALEDFHEEEVLEASLVEAVGVVEVAVVSQGEEDRCCLILCSWALLAFGNHCANIIQLVLAML